MNTNVQEIWKQIEGFDNKYEVSNHGRVRNIQTGTILKTNLNTSGYTRVGLCQRGAKNTISLEVHRLVAKYFIPNPEGKIQVNHIDSNRANPHVDNLEFATPSENQIHAYRFGNKISRFKGERNPTNKITALDALAIFNDNRKPEIIASEYDISASQIRNIKNGYTWGYITGKVYAPNRKKVIL